MSKLRADYTISLRPRSLRNRRIARNSRGILGNLNQQSRHFWAGGTLDDGLIRGCLVAEEPLLRFDSVANVQKPRRDDLRNMAYWPILEFKGESPSWTTAPIDWPHCCAHG